MPGQSQIHGLIDVLGCYVNEFDRKTRRMQNTIYHHRIQGAGLFRCYQ